MQRRSFLAGTAAAALMPWRLPQGPVPVPSPAQHAWQRDELALFLHFGVNTFTDREWGDGTEDPAIFAPTALDARQWARSARAAGYRAMVLTAKHHDGFCLWPSRTTTHSVARSPWRGGGGDLVREFVDACRAEGLKPGLYCSPWDRNAPVYGDSPRYNAMYREQLTELLTGYGQIDEVWFDGANGEGPNGKRQVYDWPTTFGLVRRLQPNAVMFSDAGPDVRWIGNEKGTAGDPNWSTVRPELVPYPGVSGPGVIEALQHGNRDGTVWRPGETDVSIRPGWFYHPAEDEKVRSVENLAELYFTSVGRNSKLLLNVPPTRDGLLHQTDVERLTGMRQRLDQLFGGETREWRALSLRPESGGFVAEADLGRSASLSLVRLEEDIRAGQAVAEYELTGSSGGEWMPLSTGTTIGYAKLDRFPAVTVRRIRLKVLDSLRVPGAIRVGMFGER
jgi:alpha-L-fucosidase